MSKDTKFTEAMNKVYHMAIETGHDDVMEYIFCYFLDEENEVLNDYEFIPAYRQNECGMYGLLRDLMNYDWFWVNEDGTIDVENANYPEVAKAIQPYVTKEMGLQALASFPRIF